MTLRPSETIQHALHFSIPLHLAEFTRIEPLFLSDTGVDETFRTTFRTGSQFYLQALQNVERTPEVAYLHLITIISIKWT